ncbi:hypothetical protein ABZY45_19850 [Streptomyces sp. NPDC006516]|uniref:hypothetical protein n=1 Tax=Streptomyces sp. NPDC006516 TaxID=3154309 RepID=UPI0033A0B6CF
MDSAVTGSLIASSAAVLAAGAALGAGRFQARGAHHGPIDAVRRQHQREAYAALLSALYAFTEATNPTAVARSLYMEAEAAGAPISRTEAELRASIEIQNTDTTPVRSARAVVVLEGPDSVVSSAYKAANLAQVVTGIAATEVHAIRSGGAQWRQLRTAFLRELDETLGDSGFASEEDPLAAAYSQLTNHVAEFAEAARDALSRRPQ